MGDGKVPQKWERMPLRSYGGRWVSGSEASAALTFRKATGSRARDGLDLFDRSGESDQRVQPIRWASSGDTFAAGEQQVFYCAAEEVSAFMLSLQK